MKFLIYLEISLLLLQLNNRTVCCADDEDCFVESFPEWSDIKTLITIPNHVQKNATDEIIFSQSYEYVASVTPTPTDDDYFDAFLESTQFVVKTTENIINIDENNHQQSSSKAFPFTVTLTCANGKERIVAFTITIDDVNLHSPEFTKTSYEFTLPMPMPYNIDLIQFGESIVVTDGDFSTKLVTFTSPLEELVLTTNSGTDYSYVLGMCFSSITKYEKTTTFILTATDDGVPPLSSTVEVIFNIDEENTEYTPSFSQPSYIYDYDPDTVTISAESEVVTIENSKDTIECQILGDYSSYFKEPVLSSSIVEIQLEKALPQSSAILRVTLSCGIPKNTIGYADVVINIPEEKVYFSKNSYTAQYLIEEDVHTISMSDAISLTENTEDIVIEVEDEFADYFEVQENEEGSNEWVLNKKKDLDSDHLKYISLSIMISVNQLDRSFSDKASITLMLPNGETGVTFTSSYFTAQYTYDENNKGELTIDSEIVLNTQYVDVEKYSIEGEYADYFVMSYEEPSTFSITTNGDLPADALKLDTIPLTLHTEFSLGSVTQSADSTLLLYLSKSSTTSTTTPTTTDTTAKTTTAESSTDSPTSTTSTSTTDTTAKTTTAESSTDSPTSTTKRTTTDTTAKTTTAESSTDSPTSTTTPTTTDTTAKTTTAESSTDSPTSTIKRTTTDTTAKTTTAESSTDSPTSTTKRTTTDTTAKTATAESSTDSPTSTTSTSTTDDCEYTVWLIVTILLSLTLVIYVGASLLYYFMRIRNRTNDLDYFVEEEKIEHFQKKTSSYDKKKNSDPDFPLQEEVPKKKILQNNNNHFKDISTRRPTGFIRFDPDLDKKNDNENSDTETQNNTKTNIAVKQPVSKLKDVASRRPTGFIRFTPDVDKEDDHDSESESDSETQQNTNANKIVDPPAPPPLPTDKSKKMSLVGKTVEFQETPTNIGSNAITLADELKIAVKERESRLI